MHYASTKGCELWQRHHRRPQSRRTTTMRLPHGAPHCWLIYATPSLRWQRAGGCWAAVHVTVNMAQTNCKLLHCTTHPSAAQLIANAWHLSQFERNIHGKQYSQRRTLERWSWVAAYELTNKFVSSNDGLPTFLAWLLECAINPFSTGLAWPKHGMPWHGRCTQHVRKRKKVKKKTKQTGDKTFKLHTSFVFGLNRSTTENPPQTQMKRISATCMQTR